MDWHNKSVLADEISLVYNKKHQISKVNIKANEGQDP